METQGPVPEVVADYRALVASRVGDLSRFGDEAIKWMEEAELMHKSRLFYSDEVKGGETDLDIRRYAQNGRAKGFTARGKSFTRALGWRPSQAIRQFLGGDKTVCECEGLMHAVMYNALCDVLGPLLFDTVFPEIPIGLGFEAAITWRGRSILPRVDGERAFEPGDWVYILTGARTQFLEAVQETGHGGAAGGWNLIYVGNGKYMGFGLSGGRAASYTLDEIRDKMVADIFDQAKGDEDDVKKPAPTIKRRGSADFSSRAGSSLTSSFFSSSSSPSSSSAGRNRAMIRNSIQIQFSRRLDVNVLTAWVRNLL